MTEPTPPGTSTSPGSEFGVPCERRGWSRLGIASIVVGFLSAAMFVAAVALAMVWELGHGSNATARVDAHKLVVGLTGLAAFVGLLVGTGLGIGGLFESKHQRDPAIAGLIFNALGLILVALLPAWW